MSERKLADSPSPSPKSSKPRIDAKVRGALEVLVVVAVFFGIRAWQRKDVVSGAAPELRGATIDGRPIALDGGDGATLVHFWASWCGVCDAMDGQVESVAKHARVITIATRSGDANAIRASMREDGLEQDGRAAFDVVADPNGELARAWGVTTLPTSFVVDRNGRIVATEVGFSTSLGLRARLAWAD